MPFKPITRGKKKGKYRSPSGRTFTHQQVKAYYATGGFSRRVRDYELEAYQDKGHAFGRTSGSGFKAAHAKVQGQEAKAAIKREVQQQKQDLKQALANLKAELKGASKTRKAQLRVAKQAIQHQAKSLKTKSAKPLKGLMRKKAAEKAKTTPAGMHYVFGRLVPVGGRSRSGVSGKE